MFGYVEKLFERTIFSLRVPSGNFKVSYLFEPEVTVLAIFAAFLKGRCQTAHHCVLTLLVVYRDRHHFFGVVE